MPVAPGTDEVGRTQLIAVARELSAELAGLRFAAPVTHVYDPLAYAWEPHAAYLRKFGAGAGRTVLVGMNPGPFGMAQTGVPFGEVALVRDWMGISGAVHRPDPEHPKRPVLGFDHPRSEVSGQRLWGWARDRYGTADAFFARFFVANWCPLCFLEASGRNRTPDKLPANERNALYAACDRALRRTVEALEPRWVIGVGALVEQRAREALQGLDVRIGRVLHPSPASPAANQGWRAQAEAELTAQGVEL
jgi:single-strand selective monofunctional uracil DNA glycosylase